MFMWPRVVCESWGGDLSDERAVERFAVQQKRSPPDGIGLRPEDLKLLKMRKHAREVSRKATARVTLGGLTS